MVEFGLSDRVANLGNVSDAHLAKLDNCSIALVYPSLYEGFGIPPLEAMRRGTAVVASNTSKYPEVVGDASLFFDRTVIDELADILQFLFDNPSDRDHLITKGYERSKLFSWDKTVAQTIDVYRSVCD